MTWTSLNRSDKALKANPGAYLNLRRRKEFNQFGSQTFYKVSGLEFSKVST